MTTRSGHIIRWYCILL